MKTYYYLLEFCNGETYSCKTRNDLKNTIENYCKIYNDNNEDNIYPISINQLDSLFNNRLIYPTKNKPYIMFLGKQELKNIISIDDKRIKYYGNNGRPYCSQYIEKQRTNLVKLEIDKQHDKFMDRNNYNRFLEK